MHQANAHSNSKILSREVNSLMVIAVIDGQGGGIGRTIVEKLKAANITNAEIMALGTNATATGVMMKAGADEGDR